MCIRDRAEKMLANKFNRLGQNIVNHYTYTFLGDGLSLIHI